MKGCSKELQTSCAGHFMFTEEQRHEKVQRASAARRPPWGAAPRPARARMGIFESALVGVFRFPQKAPLGGSPLKIEFWACIRKDVVRICRLRVPDISCSLRNKDTKRSSGFLPPAGPLGGQHPAPRAQEWVFFESALMGVFLFPKKSPLGGSPLKIEFWACI